MKARLAVTNKATTTGIFFTVIIFVLVLLVLPFHLTKLGSDSSLELNIKVYVDQGAKASLSDIKALPENAWQATNEHNFGLSKEPLWLSFTIKPAETSDNRLLLINYPLLDNIQIWFLENASQDESLLAKYDAGDATPFEARAIKAEDFVFAVPDSQKEITVYIRTLSDGALKIPIEIWDQNGFIEYSSLQKLFLGLFFGYMIAMGLSNLFAYASTRKSIFLLYTGYVCGIAMVVSGLHGISFHYLWPNNVWLQEFSVPLFTCLTMVFIISLTISLLNLKRRSLRIYTTLKYIRYVFAAMFVLCFFAPYQLVLQTVLVLLIVTMPMILLSGILLALKGDTVARYFCAAWATLLISGVSIAMENFGIFDSPIDSSYLVMVGAIAEAQLLAFAVAINFNQQLQQTKRARDLALKNEQEAVAAKDELIELQEKNQADLEYSIEERTLELEIALRELAEKNRELEKLSAIDPLTGLMNRRYFDKRILAESRRSKREMTKMSIAMLDIDHFKKINDTYGHLCGDHCLKVFSDILRETIKRPSDTICRYGGEEFVLILPNTDEEGLANLLEKVRSNVEARIINFEQQEISITVSIGGSSRIVANEDEHEKLMAFVDKKLYEAKESGRNKVLVERYEG